MQDKEIVSEDLENGSTPSEPKSLEKAVGQEVKPFYIEEAPIYADFVEAAKEYADCHSAENKEWNPNSKDPEIQIPAKVLYMMPLFVRVEQKTKDVKGERREVEGLTFVLEGLTLEKTEEGDIMSKTRTVHNNICCEKILLSVGFTREQIGNLAVGDCVDFKAQETKLRFMKIIYEGLVESKRSEGKYRSYSAIAYTKGSLPKALIAAGLI